MSLIFWASILLLGYTFAGYPLLMRLLARAAPRPVTAPADGWQQPSVTVVVAAYNAGEIIGDRVRNLIESDYPTDRLHVLVASDGSVDDTAEQAKAAGGSQVAVLEFTERRGKPACLNDALEHAGDEIVVFADARQRFETDAVARLVENFGDPAVAAVSGELEIARSEGGVGEGIGGYWKIERRLRADESTFDSCIGCTGAIYAIRRESYIPIPADTLIDDVVIPLQIAEGGGRVLFDRRARAFDPQPLEPAQESVRKRRTLGGNFQMLFRYPGWLSPWGHRCWWQIISHKYLRVIAPLFLATALAANLWLAAGSLFYALLLAAHAGFYTIAVLGLCTPLRRWRLCSIPASFLFLNHMSVAGLLYFLRSAGRKGW